jgi:hypothetical protein
MGVAKRLYHTLVLWHKINRDSEAMICAAEMPSTVQNKSLRALKGNEDHICRRLCYFKLTSSKWVHVDEAFWPTMLAICDRKET